MRYIERGLDFGRPDLVVLLGTKTTVRDLDWLRQVGLADRIQAARKEEDGPRILGVCGWVPDARPLGRRPAWRRVESPAGRGPRASRHGYPVLRVTKTRHLVSGRVLGSDLDILGYEIHMGETERGRATAPAFADAAGTR